MNIKQTTQLSTNDFSNQGKRITVGICNPGYGYERVSYSLNLMDFNFKRLYTVPLYRVFRSDSQFYKYTPVVFDFGVNLLHTWNSLPISIHPFVVSFECELPRYLGCVFPWQMKFGKKVLRSKRCRGILALSEAAKNKFTLDCEQDDDVDLIKKLVVFRGGVDLPITHKNTYSVSGPLKLLFVGTDAVRKGIVPLYNACQNLIQQGVDISLTFIGGFNERCYVYGEHMPDIKKLDDQLKSSEWVDYQGKVPVMEVLTQMKVHDILAFPTFDESLGWVPIEAGLLGVPTIATDIFAIPELVVHKETGYLISISKRTDRRFIGLGTVGNEQRQHLDDTEKAIESELVTAINYLYENRKIIEKWGRASRSKLEKMYSPKVAQPQLSKIYKTSLK